MGFPDREVRRRRPSAVGGKLRRPAREVGCASGNRHGQAPATSTSQDLRKARSTSRPSSSMTRTATCCGNGCARRISRGRSPWILSGMSLWSDTPSGTTLLDFSTLKYDPAGVLLWSATFDGALHNNDGAFGVALDPAGNAYVTGPGFMTSQLADYITVKYSPEGSLLWARSYDGAAARRGHSLCDRRRRFRLLVCDGNRHVDSLATSTL